jgi:formylglycine-generating enzyme required for sulfatase activity
VLGYSTPEIEVHLATFYIEKTEVTYAQYLHFLNGLAAQGMTHLNGCQQRQCIRVAEDVPDNPNKVLSFDGTRYRVREGFENKSVYGPSWYGAAAYCESIGRRLPTEAEWERAARGNDRRIYPWGNTWDAIRAESDEAGASPYGVQDMAGGLPEWVNDWWQPGYYTALSHEPGPIIHPTGPETGVLNMKRGVRGRSVEVGNQWLAPAFLRGVGDMGIEGVNPGYTDIVTIRCAKDY